MGDVGVKLNFVISAGEHALPSGQAAHSLPVLYQTVPRLGTY